MYADLVIISFIYIGNEIRATIQFLLCEAFLKSSSILLNLTEPMALIPENATIENKVEFQNLCQVFYIQCYIIKSDRMFWDCISYNP